MQSTASFAGEWRFLTGGAFACLCSTSLARPVGAKSPRDTLFEFGVCNGEISTAYGVLLYPILGGVARCGWLGPGAMGRHQSPYDPPKLLLFEAEGMHVLLAYAYTQKHHTLSFCAGICSGLPMRFFFTCVSVCYA